MKFLFDYNCSPRITKALAHLEGPGGNTVEYLGDKFPNDTSDVDWLTALSREGGWSSEILGSNLETRQALASDYPNRRISGTW